MVCTNHLLHRRPDPRDLPGEMGSDGTAALTYTRWRTLDAQVTDGAVVDHDSIREQFRTVRFESPVPGARTFWNAIYDADDPSVELTFYLRDEDGVSRYTEPQRITL